MKTQIWMIEAHMGEDGHVDAKQPVRSRERRCDICDGVPAWRKLTRDIIAGWAEGRVYPAKKCVRLCPACARRECLLW